MFSFVKIFFILIIFLFVTACHEKDYDIIRDFIMKDQEAKSSKKLETLEADKAIKAKVENKKKEASNLAKKDKQVDSLETKKPKKKIGHAGADPGTHVAILRPKSSDTLIEPTTQHHEPTNDMYAIHVLVEEGNQGGRHERFAAHHKT